MTITPDNWSDLNPRTPYAYDVLSALVTQAVSVQSSPQARMKAVADLTRITRLHGQEITLQYVRQRQHLTRSFHDLERSVQQQLGAALHYPAYADDQLNFPGATAEDGVCVGEHTAETLALEAAQRIAQLEAENRTLRDQLHTLRHEDTAHTVIHGTSGEPYTWLAQATAKSDVQDGQTVVIYGREDDPALFMRATDDFQQSFSEPESP